MMMKSLEKGHTFLLYLFSKEWPMRSEYYYPLHIWYINPIVRYVVRCFNRKWRDQTFWKKINNFITHHWQEKKKKKVWQELHNQPPTFSFLHSYKSTSLPRKKPINLANTSICCPTYSCSSPPRTRFSHYSHPYGVSHQSNQENPTEARYNHNTKLMPKFSILLKPHNPLFCFRFQPMSFLTAYFTHLWLPLATRV